MRKALRKYLLTICILLLNGYSCLYAVPNQDSVSNSTVNVQKNSLYPDFCNHSTIQALISKQGLSSGKGNPCFYSEEKEKEEECFKLVSIKTYNESGNYFTAYRTKISWGFFCNVNNRLPVYEHWFYSSSHRFSILQVIRI